MSQIKSIGDQGSSITTIQDTNPVGGAQAAQQGSIKKESSRPSMIKPIRSKRDTGVTSEEFASSLPEWDIVPPLVAVRRIRKR
ncbi:hypothetical protein [uncultured Veillonella sp.]|uniref:hypothetical protein n=1 Tax=uncultured Veillonella sp. TaxID=159268 RepID=UPI002634363D|nr:hypothetical protein [uncultured Veillonella sp.]